MRHQERADEEARIAAEKAAEEARLAEASVSMSAAPERPNPAETETLCPIVVRKWFLYSLCEASRKIDFSGSIPSMQTCCH